MSLAFPAPDGHPPSLKRGGKGVVLLVSGEMDKALLAFEIAAGFQAMGMNMHMWFVLYGVNCLRKPRSRFSWSKWFSRLPDGPGRSPATDTGWQRLIRGLNFEGAGNIPLSQLNYGGLGGWIIRRVMRRKGMMQLEELILQARELGVQFRICQICVDAMALAVQDDLIVPAEVLGVSAYYMDVQDADYHATF